MLKHTPLHQAHLDLSAKMGEFAGYDMPLYYAAGVMAEHEWTRAEAGLFDVSHMGQIILTGKGIAQFWESMTPSDFSKLSDGAAKYSVLTNEKGGIIDDLIVTRISEEKWFAVLNAGRKDVDLAWLRKNLPSHIRLDYLDGKGLIALQGPKAEAALREALGIDTSDLGYMQARSYGDIFVSRLGYTGEDGFELGIAPEKTAEAWGKLLAHKAVKPVGLAARDSLRLEMGYCLYGHDIDETTSPVEACLSWVMAKDGDGYTGANIIREQRKSGVARKRVGIRLTDKGIARENSEIRNDKDEKIGMLTSGGFSPTLKEAIGQGYVETAYAENGTKLFVNVRGRNIAAEICPLSFVAAKTKSVKKAQAA
jgi:aminomethyltransferase